MSDVDFFLHFVPIPVAKDIWSLMMSSLFLRPAIAVRISWPLTPNRSLITLSSMVCCFIMRGYWALA